MLGVMRKEIHMMNLLARNEVDVLVWPTQCLDRHVIANDIKVCIRRQKLTKFLLQQKRDVGKSPWRSPHHVCHPCGKLCKETGGCKVLQWTGTSTRVFFRPFYSWDRLRIHQDSDQEKVFNKDE